MRGLDLVRPSRDGDQFHYLWASRRCLELLASESDLVAVSIEGSSPNEGPGGARAGETVIDIGEYYGDEDLSEARFVRYSQLKHSSRHSAEPWSASGLRETIKGFAAKYGEMLQTFSRETLATKLEFSFVTNRPISPAIVCAIEDAANGVKARYPLELQKLAKFTHLKGEDLSAFLKILRLQGGEDGVWQQRNILLQDFAGYLPDVDVDAPIRLKDLVTRKASSEGAQNPTITKIDVLRSLNTDEERLFPAPNLISDVKNVIARSQEEGLIRSIVTAYGPVIVHAPAGVGKTVFASKIGAHLPSRSVSVLYDCFGNGSYRSASRYRHRHKDALVQIANELGSKGLCHPLIPSPLADNSSYMRAFLYRITQASKILAASDSAALVCLVIDAADNAQMAAEEAGEARSFVRDLIREQFPSNVRVVFLCRSHRLNYLDPPLSTLTLELKPFNEEETALCLRRKFHNATDQDVEEFHRLSSHNPRVQALALSRVANLYETLRLLGPNPTSVDDTIGTLLESAITKLKDAAGDGVERHNIDRVCAAMAMLRPLIPLHVLAAVSGIPTAAIKSFAIDLGRPLLLAGENIQFLDEPAESWFRERFKPPAPKMLEFISALRPLAVKNAYVASVLPQLLLEAGQFAELVETALSSTDLPTSTPLERRDVELQRLQFALQASLRSRRYVDAAKLALKAGGESAGTDRERNIIQQNTDLAATFLAPNILEEIVSRRTFGSGWLGSHHAYEAGLLSGSAELKGDARSRLRMAYEWLHNRRSLSTEELKEEKVEDVDVLELTMAQINIHGPEAGARSLAAWTPRAISFRVGELVARRLLDHGRLDDLEKFVISADIAAALSITMVLADDARYPPIAVTRRTLRFVRLFRITWNRSALMEPEYTALNVVCATVEAALRSNLCTRQEAASILSRHLPTEAPRGLESHYSKSRAVVLRAHSLCAALLGKHLTPRDLAHDELKNALDKKTDYSSEDVREFRGVIGRLLPWYQFSADVSVGNVTGSSFLDELQKTRDKARSADVTYYRDYGHVSNEMAGLWILAASKAGALNGVLLQKFVEWKDELKHKLFAPTLNSLSRLLAREKDLAPVALNFALEAFQLTKESRSDAEAKSVGYVAAARSILTINRDEAAAYFTAAVDVASKIGNENLFRWDAVLDLADCAAIPNGRHHQLAYRLARSAELTYDYVDRDKHFDWGGTVRSLCGLSPTSAIAILSRWRDRKFGRIERLLPIAFQQLLDQGAISPLDAQPFVGFRANWKHHDLLRRILPTITEREAKDRAVAHLFKYAQFSEERFAEIEKTALEHGIVLPEVKERAALEELVRIKQKSKNEYPDTHKVPLEWNLYGDGKNPSVLDEFLEIYSNWRVREKYLDHEGFFAEVFKHVPLGREASFIAMLENVPQFDLYHLGILLKQLPSNYEQLLSVKMALNNTARSLFKRNAYKIARTRHWENFPYERLYKLTDMSDVDLSEVVLNTLGEASGAFSSDRFFTLISLLVSKLSQDEAIDALSFGLDFYDNLFEPTDGDGNWTADLAPPEGVRESLAGFVWAALGAPEACLRWEAAHVVLGGITLNRVEFLGHLMTMARGHGAGPFSDATLPFYRLNALQWLLIGIARGALENPTCLAPFIGQLIDWALYDQPHVIIREFAARAAISLIDCGIFPNHQGQMRQDLLDVNRSRLPIVQLGSHERELLAESSMPQHQDKEDSYLFGIDFGPYWFAPLAHVFGLRSGAIEREALDIVVKYFGLKSEWRWDADPRHKRKLYTEGHTYHSHGSYPRADALDYYYSYHAMMIAAGRVLATTSIQREPNSDTDEFADWLERHDLSRKDGRWLADRRDLPPLDAVTRRDRAGAYQKVTPGLSEFDELVLSGTGLRVWGGWTEANGERQQLVSITSALVNRDKSDALVRALEALENAHDLSLPAAQSHSEVAHPGFDLKGWVTSESPDRGLDRFDPWSGGISFPPPVPSTELAERLSLKPDVDLRSWCDGDARALYSEVWGHYDDGEDRYESSNPNAGERLTASRHFLQGMLSKLDRDLILRVKVDRRRRYRWYGHEENEHETIPTHAKTFRFTADGEFR